MKALSTIQSSAVLRQYVWLATFCLICIILPTACNSLVKEVEVPDYTGEQLFRGLMMGQGPVATLVPSVTSQAPDLETMVQDAEQLKAVLMVEDHVVEQIKKDFPNFFFTFKKSIQSGDHIKVKEALKQSNEIVVKAIYQLPEYKKNKAVIENSRKSLSNIDYRQFLDGNGKLNTNALQKHIKNQFRNSGIGGVTTNCGGIAIPIVIIVAAAVLIVVAVGIATGLAVTNALGVAVVAIFNVAYAVNNTVTFPEGMSARTADLRGEIVVDEIATNLNRHFASTID